VLDSKTYIKVTKVIFFIVGLLHLVRIVMGWPLIIGGWEIPVWASALGVIVPWYIAYNGYTLLGKKK